MPSNSQQEEDNTLSTVFITIMTAEKKGLVQMKANAC